MLIYIFVQYTLKKELLNPSSQLIIQFQVLNYLLKSYKDILLYLASIIVIEKLVIVLGTLSVFLPLLAALVLYNFTLIDINFFCYLTFLEIIIIPEYFCVSSTEIFSDIFLKYVLSHLLTIIFFLESN